MLSVPASSCRLVGTLGMLFLFTLAIPVQAAERRGLGRAGSRVVFLTAGHLIPDRYVLVDAHQQPVDFTQGEYGFTAGVGSKLPTSLNL